MKSATLVLALALAVAAAPAARSSAVATTLCVGGKPSCYPTLQAAVDAAHDGDTIAIAPGTYAGGVTIDVSVDLRGAGIGATIIQGGGPVLTIGVQDAPAEPTVSIDGVTITGGVNTSHPDTVVTLGGGVWIPRAAGFTTGATVSISDSLITGNRATPQGTNPFCGVPCAFATGGGINNEGTLTVTNTRITDNETGSTPTISSVALGAGAAGIENGGLGTLVLRRSVVSGNRARVNAPIGVFTQGGGIESNGTATIEDSVISGNSVTTTGADGEGDAFAGGIRVAGPLTMRNTFVTDNEVNASVSASSNVFVFAAAGGIGVDFGAVTLDGVRITGNSVTGVGPGVPVFVNGGGLGNGSFDGVVVTRSLIARNSVTGATTSGAAFAEGGGVSNFGVLTLDHTQVIDNRASETGPGGHAHGGGVANDTFPGAPAPALTVTDSVIAANSLGAEPGVPIGGGGLFSATPVTVTHTEIAGNKPDQCAGC